MQRALIRPENAAKVQVQGSVLLAAPMLLPRLNSEKSAGRFRNNMMGTIGKRNNKDQETGA
jgi:hypothetical protein